MKRIIHSLVKEMAIYSQVYTYGKITFWELSIYF